MVESVLVYGFMMISTYLIGVKYKKNVRIAYFLNTLIFIFFSAFRYDVGVDYLSYLEGYVYMKEHGYFSREDSEMAFVTLNNILANLDCSITTFFGVCALIQISFLFLALRKDKYLLPYLILFLLGTGEYFSWMNGMRQIVAFTIFLYSLNYLFDSKSLYKCFFWVVIASLFHKSALLMIPVCVLLYLKKGIWIEKLYIRLFIIIGSYLLSFGFNFSNYLGYIDSLMGIIGYERYSNASEILEGQSLNMGPRYMITLVNGLIITLCANNIYEKSKNKLYAIIYNLFFIGMVLTPLFRDSLHLMRVLMYFNATIFIMDAYTFCYLKSLPNTLRNVLVRYIFFIIGVLFLIITLYVSTSEDHVFYQFIFNKYWYL